MSGFVTAPIGNAALAPAAANAPVNDYPASVWDSQDWFGGSKQLARGIGSAAATLGTADDFGRPITEPEPAVPADELNARYGIDGHLRFDNPLPESVASSMHDAKRDELMRADAASRSDAGTLARFGAGLVSGLVDPLNIAASFVPAVAEARVMGLLAKAGLEGAGGALAAKAATGGLNALSAQVPLTALRYGLSQQEGADYSMTDALADIAIGTLIGGGLHTAIGGAGDLVGNRFARSAAKALADDDPVAREAMVRASVAQMVQGEPVNLAPVLDSAPLGSAFAARLRARGETGDGTYAAYTPEGLRVELLPGVIELARLIASHNDDGSVNPAFPHEDGMQPRDRSNAASQAQITEMASRLEPERLGPSPEASTGAPIVNRDNVVESGNGRILALRRVYNDPALADQATAYRAFLQARGNNIEGMTAPVLIGRRLTDLAPEDARAFVRGANERATLGLSTAEQARMDATRAGNAITDYRSGAIGSSVNHNFVSAFMAQIPAEERGAMILGNGQLSAQGEARIRAALLAHAYGDALGPTLERMLNGDTEHMKAAAGALADVAGMWSKLRVAAERGEIPAGLDITPAIGEAVQLLDRARSTGTPIAALLAQADLGGGPSPAAVGLLRLMFRDEAMRLPVARAKLGELLDRYVEEALKAQPGRGLFGDAETTPADIMRTILAGDARGEAAARGLTASPEEIPGAVPEPQPPAPSTATSLPDGAVPKEIVDQIATLTADLKDAVGTEAEMRAIAEAGDASKNLIAAAKEAASCLLEGLA